MAPVLAIVCGGGPAPGMNCVISSATMAARDLGWEVIGLYDGFKHLVEGRTDMVAQLNATAYSAGSIKVSRIHSRGGTVLRTARVNPTKDPVHMANAIEALRKLNVKYLITIGGDDTATSAFKLSEAAGGAFSVAHVCKTIDNDLPLPAGIPTFGYETARDVGCGIVHNLMNDSKSTVRWYLCVAMGRAAGHLALGIGKSAGATLTIIPEECVARGGVTFKNICDIVEGSVIKRRSQGKDYGVIILAEGLAEYMTEQDIMDAFGTADLDAIRDEHGHLRLAEVEIGRAVRNEVVRRFKAREQALTIIDKNLGYELRCADPTPFDIAYTRDLGCGAVEFLSGGGNKSMITMTGEALTPVPFTDFVDPKTQKARTRVVDVRSSSFKTSLIYMIRLNKSDRAPAEMKKLAEAANMSLEAFEKQFSYLMTDL